MLKIRMSRLGRKGRPFYRMVVSDSRNTPRSSNVDIVGHYNPLTEPAELTVDLDKVDGWLAKGAQPSGRAHALIKEARKSQGAQAEA